MIFKKIDYKTSSNERNQKNRILFLYSTAVVILFSCSSSTKHQILSTFFDGVPDPNAKPKAIVDSLKADSLANIKNENYKTVNEVKFVFHPPYKNRLCKDCHNLERSNQLTKPIPDLCYKCHEKFSKKTRHYMVRLQWAIVKFAIVRILQRIIFY